MTRMWKTVLLAFLLTAPAVAAFGAAVTDRQSAQYKRWHWYELNDAQASKLAAALGAVGPAERQPVNVECADSDCRGLAKDFVDAFAAGGWQVRIIASGFIGNEPGLYCSDAAVCAVITKATGIKTKIFRGQLGLLTIVFGPKQ